MRVCKKMWLLTALSCSLWNVRNAMDRVVTPPTPQFQGCGCMCHSFSGEFQILCYMATLKLRGRGGSILFLEVRWWSVCWGGSFRWLGISQQHRATGGRLLQTHSLPLLSNCTDEWEPFPIAQLAVAVTDIALNLGRKKGWFLRSISWDQFWVHFFFRNGCLSWWGLRGGCLGSDTTVACPVASPMLKMFAAKKIEPSLSQLCTCALFRLKLSKWQIARKPRLRCHTQRTMRAKTKRMPKRILTRFQCQHQSAV